MIPKLIHYCWFGGNPLPNDAAKCIESWKKYFPDYEIKEWNDSNFDLNCCDYVREAYEAKKWAFVSDYARFWILYRYGGLYFDTDVEVIKDMSDIVAKGAFMGCEPVLSGAFNINPSLGLAVNPGLGLAANPGLGLYKEILDDYEKDHFVIPDKGVPKSVVYRTTEILVKHGFKGTQEIQEFEDVFIYPPEYFCPLSYVTGILNTTKNTRSIHHYTESWLNDREKKINKIQQKYAAQGRPRCTAERLQTLPLRFQNKFSMLGFAGTIKFAFKKLMKKV